MSSEKGEITRYLPYTIYENIQKFLTYRSLELVAGAQYNTGDSKKTSSSKNAEFLPEDEFVKNIQYYGYIQIEAKDAKDKDRHFHKSIPSEWRKKPVHTYIILLDQNSVYKSTQQFVKLLERIPGMNSETRDYNIELIVIAREKLSLHVQKKINTYITNGSVPGAETKFGYRHIADFEYAMFSSDKLTNKFSQHHRILNKSDEKAILTRLMCTKKDLDKIRKTDPPLVWLGAEIGDIIEIRRFSETTAEEIAYRVVRG